MKYQPNDHYNKFYIKKAKRSKLLTINSYARAKESAAWKEEIISKWDSVEAVSCEKTEELARDSTGNDKEYTITYAIDGKGLNDAIGLELVTTCTAQGGEQHVYSVEPFNIVKKEGDLYTFRVKHKLGNTDSLKAAYRMSPKNVGLFHRQDFCYIR